KVAFLERLEQFRTYLSLLAGAHVGGRLRVKVDPEDLVQETFLAAISAATTFRGAYDAELLARLRQVLPSRILKAVKRYFGTAARDVRREFAHLLDTPADSSQSPACCLLADLSTPSRTVQRRERAAVVANALAALAPDHRDVLVLRNLEGL